MGKRLSPEALEMVATRFRILSEPIRLRLIHLLRDGELSVNELTSALPTSQPNVSKHLKILTESGLLNRDQRGNMVYYSIADGTTFQLCELVCDSLSERLKEQASFFATA